MIELKEPTLEDIRKQTNGYRGLSAEDLYKFVEELKIKECEKVLHLSVELMIDLINYIEIEYGYMNIKDKEQTIINFLKKRYNE